MVKKFVFLVFALFFMASLSHAGPFVVKNILTHDITYENSAIIHTISSHEYNIENIQITDYIPLELEPEQAVRTEYNGGTYYKKTLSVEKLNAGETKTLTYKINPVANGTFTIYSHLTYTLLGEGHEKIPVEKQVTIDNVGYTENYKYAENNYILLAGALIALLAMFAFRRYRK